MASIKYQYNFDDFSLIPHEGLLLQNNKFVPLSNRAFKVLLLLVRKEGKVVQKQEFLDEVWADTFVEEGNLAVAINSLRKILHSKEKEQIYIETFSRRGYRFTGNVEKVLIDESPKDEIVYVEKAEPKSTQILSQTDYSELRNSVVRYSLLKRLYSTLFSNLKKKKWLSVILVSIFLLYTFTANIFQQDFLVHSAGIEKGQKKIRVAVLPFVNLNPTKETKSFGFSFTESMISELSHDDNISVTSSGETAKYYQKIIEFDEIKNEVDADYVLTGFFVKDGDNLTVTSQLIQVKTGEVPVKTKINLMDQDVWSLRKNLAKDISSKISFDSKETLSASLYEKE